MKVLVALRFFAMGGTLRDVGDLHRISKATARQIVSNVSNGSARSRNSGKSVLFDKGWPSCMAMASPPPPFKITSY